MFESRGLAHSGLVQMTKNSYFNNLDDFAPWALLGVLILGSIAIFLKLHA